MGHFSFFCRFYLHFSWLLIGCCLQHDCCHWPFRSLTPDWRSCPMTSRSTCPWCSPETSQRSVPLNETAQTRCCSCCPSRTFPPIYWEFCWDSVTLGTTTTCLWICLTLLGSVILRTLNRFCQDWPLHLYPKTHCRHWISVPSLSNYCRKADVYHSYC